jgi:exodeoxyribonuclease III
MRVLAWNIQSGGAPRSDAIANAIIKHNPDVVVLTEYRASSAPIVKTLKDAGLGFAALSDPKPNVGGVAILSRLPIRKEEDSARMGEFHSRLLTVLIPDAELRVCGIYGPLKSEALDDWWRSALDILRCRAEEPVLVAGDFNTGEPLRDFSEPKFPGSDYFAELPRSGYVDLWRRLHGLHAREATLKRTNEYRIDHAFATTSLLPRVVDCRYSHAEREQKLSDHSPIIVELTSSDG